MKNTTTYRLINPISIPFWLLDALNSPVQAIVLQAAVQIAWLGGEITSNSIQHALALDRTTTSIRRAVNELVAKGYLDADPGDSSIEVKWDSLTDLMPLGGGTIGGGLNPVNQSNPVNQVTGNKVTGKQVNTLNQNKENKESNRVGGGGLGEGEGTQSSPLACPPLLKSLIKSHPQFESNAFFEAWNDWVQYRKESGNRITPIAAKRQLREIAKCGEPSLVIAAINLSIVSGWRGLFLDNTDRLRREASKMQVSEQETIRTEGGGFIPPTKK